MVLQLERPQLTASRASVRPLKRGWARWPELGALTAVLISTFLYGLASRINPNAVELEFTVVSDVAFQEDTPRTAYLITSDGNGNVETFEDNRFASAFIDQRSSFRFSIPNPPPNRIFFCTPAVGHLISIIGIRAIDASHKVIQIPLEQLVAHQQVEIVARNPQSVSFKTFAGNRLPTVELKRSEGFDLSTPKTIGLRWMAPVFGIIAVSGCLLLIFLRKQALQTFGSKISLRWAAQFGAAAALILAMAVVTKFNAHPDEYLHFEAAKYFANHTLPPALDDPVIEPSFSHYGVSYLQEFDSAHLLIGKVMSILPSWLTRAETAARLCNVLLFALLAICLIRYLPGSFAPAILLISPQIWYVFSYVNSDAWPLALAFIIVVQLAMKESLLHRYLRTDGWRTALGGGLLFSALLVLLLTSKRNYYLFLPFIVLVMIWQNLFWLRHNRTKQVLGKWAAIVLVTALLYTPIRIGLEAINRFDDTRIRLEQAEKFAAPHFKPSEIAAGEGAQRLNLRGQGVPYAHMFSEHNWAELSFQSFCGVYQWMSLFGPSQYYFLIGALYVLLLSFLVAKICTLSWEDAVFALAILGMVVLIILGSAYQSWTADFQPQGRYLFPILPMIAFLFHRYRESLRSWVFNMLFGALFACSVYSFVFTGLKNIPK